ELMLSVPGHPYVAVGECGVDLYWDASRRDEQLAAFARQAEWSIRFGLPLVVHTRNAHAEVVEVLTPLKGQLVGGIFHCFGGTADEARELLDFDNFMLGIGGVVTFKKSTLPEVLATCVPLERIVLETDAPYLAPTPYRGKRNEPAHLPLVVHRLAEIYQTTPQHIEAVTTETARRLFGL
ncbi:MAG: TatD family hydrolase, partial [Bacteroidaceae bacterium]|nr:TatD family hydrolase [Bacteroidaceae bacterium]